MDSIDKQPRHEHNQKDKNQNRKKNRSRIERLQQRTTSIAISILVAITIGVVGIEVLSAKQKDVYETTIDTTGTGSKSLKIIALDKEKNQPGVSSNSPRSWASDLHSSEASQELQRLQARKIKELKRQLSEANQKLHEVKANLFTKGDPADRAKLANICQELIEKEKHNDEFQNKIVELETERKLRNQKIVRMEQTIDALAAMTDSLRESKEKTIFNFQSQIERLEEDAEREKKEYKKIQADLKESNTALQDAIAAKMSIINTLEDEISWQYNLIKDRDQEIKSQSQLFTSSENHLQNEKKSLSVALEMAMLKNRIHSKELKKAQAHEKAQEQNSKFLASQYSKERASYQEQIDQLSSDLTHLAQDYIELQGITNIYAHSQNHLLNKQTKLGSLIQKERSHVKNLQIDLENALAVADAEQQRGLCIEEELHASAQKIGNMEVELLAKQSIIEQKAHELETLNYSTASLRDQLNARIKQLTASLEEAQNEKLAREEKQRELAINLELEKTKYQELYSKFQDTLTTNNDQAIQNNELQQQIYKDSERIIAMEDRVKDKQDEIEQLQNHTINLTHSLSQEKKRSNELHTALSHSLNENESFINTNSALQGTLEENTDMLTLLQDRIESKKRLINDIQDRLDDVSSRLTYEQSRNREIEIALEESKSQIKAEKIRTYSLISNNEDSQEALDILKQEGLEKENKINNLKRELKNQTAYSKELNAKLENLPSSQIASTTTTNINQQETIDFLQYQITKLNQMLELERYKSLAFDKAKLNKSKHTQQLEKKVDEFSSQINELESTIREQKEQLAVTRSKSENPSQPFSNRKNEIALNNRKIAKKTYADSPKQENSSTRYHKVESGENLENLSTYYYGSPNRWIDIYNANRGKIHDKHRLEVGIELTIPQ